jgi:L-lactate dehydrogenase complex protein LldG
MTGSQSNDEPYATFVARATEYGIEPERVPPEEVRERLDALLQGPAVGTPLPWEDVALPDAVTTDPTAPELEAAVTGVTGAERAIAEYGSLVLRADEAGSEPVSLFVDLHVAVVREDDILPDMAAAFEWFGDELRETRDSAIIATGPSATADMGALVQGAHGPKDVEVLVVP